MLLLRIHLGFSIILERLWSLRDTAWHLRHLLEECTGQTWASFVTTAVQNSLHWNVLPWCAYGSNINVAACTLIPTCPCRLRRLRSCFSSYLYEEEFPGINSISKDVDLLSLHWWRDWDKMYLFRASENKNGVLICPNIKHSSPCLAHLYV